ncbi:MAG TPA: S9 family peptidase [Ilumatobacteraceae bacterium]|nr:S9 family peptidase [Ilumatobacteraceae bacterium]
MSDPTAQLLALRSPLHASLSPDGARLLLTTTHVPLGTETTLEQLTIIDVATGDETPVAASVEGDHSAVWSPDGSSFAFITTRNGAAQIAVSAEGGHTSFFDIDGQLVEPPAWSPDGSTLVLVSRRGNVIDRTRPHRWTRPIAAFDSTGPLEDPPQLQLLDLAAGSTRWLTNDEWRWSTPRWAPAGDRIVAIVAHDPTGTLDGHRLRVVTVDGAVTQAPVAGGRTVLGEWLPDGRLIALIGGPETEPVGSHARLYVIDGDDVTEVIVPDLLGDVYGDQPAELADSYNHLVIPTDDALIVRIGARGRMGIARVVIDSGDTETLVDGTRCASPVGWAQGRLVFTTQSAEAPVELAVTEAGSERRLTHFAPVQPVAVTRTVVVSDLGPLDGWFIAPVGGATPLPTVLMIHGGPNFAYGEAFNHDAHALCAAGFGVLFTNPRGSTGYGDAFTHAGISDWADGPASDLMAVLQAAVDAGLVDPTRLGVTGNSYGGYMSAWLAATTTRFRAAVIENPVTDLSAMYGASDIGYRFIPANFGGTPYEQLERYAAQSPLWQAHRCTTPCLFVVGTDDRRCPSSQAWSMHRVLCGVGTPSEVLTLPGSSHEGSTYGPPAGRLAHNEALVEWMTRWVL